MSEQDEVNGLFEEPTSAEGAGITDAQHGINALGKTFVGARPPMWGLEHEQAWHRAAALAFALGASAKDVAIQLDKSQPAVQNLLRQDWFQEKVTALMAEFGGRKISQFFQAELFNSLVTLVEIRDDTAKPSAVRVACARDILDRRLRLEAD